MNRLARTLEQRERDHLRAHRHHARAYYEGRRATGLKSWSQEGHQTPFVAGRL